MWPIHVKYCEISGLSVPSWWESVLTEDCWANGPRMARAGSPGRIWAAKNTMTLRINSVISPRPIRLRMKGATVSAGRAGVLRRLRRAVQEDRRRRGWVDVLHALGGRRILKKKVRDDERRLVEQQGLDLARDLLLGLQVDSRGVLLDEVVVGGVLEVRGVPGPVRQQRGAEEHVGHAAVAVVDEAHRGVQPVGVAKSRLAVVVGLALDLEVDLDADLGRRLRDHLGQLRDLLVLLGRQLRAEAAAMARGLQELFGLGQILGALRHAGVRGRELRRKRTVVADLAEALEQCLHHPRTIQGQGDGLPDALIGEWGLVAAHRQLAMQRGLELDDVVGAAAEQRLGALDHELDDDADRA